VSRRIGSRDVALAVTGAMIGIVGLLVQDDVGFWSWIVAPLAAAALLPLHVRFLLAGDGPLRT
jgi:hypothetical protein